MEAYEEIRRRVIEREIAKSETAMAKAREAMARLKARLAIEGPNRSNP